jgi:hypothetical protein
MISLDILGLDQINHPRPVLIFSKKNEKYLFGPLFSSGKYQLSGH